ncbi:MAG TPA: VWA domain-containing protein [Candidatus Acidoferrales bacterium]|nr:VWA domain-containing protein [Candidatus Acidoferrales bacterium]
MFLRSCFSSLLLIGSLFAQQTQTAPAASQPSLTPPAATVKTRTQLVLVPVVVKDKSGKHIEHLTREQFRIEENGKPRVPAVFEELRSDAKAEAVPVNHPPEEVSNITSSGSRPHFTIVLLDMLNTPFLRQGEAKRQLIDFLSEGLAPDRAVTLLGLDSKGLIQLHSFTTDTRALIAALQKVKGGVSTSEISESETATLTDMNGDLMDSSNEIAQTISQFLQDSIDSMQAMQQRDITRRTLAALNQIAAAYVGAHERKTLIWASGGFPFTINDPRAFANMGTDMVEEYEKTWRALTSSNIAVYTVDLVGLDSRIIDASRSRAVAPSRTRSSHGNPMGTSLRFPYDASLEKQTTLRAFSDSTGGRPCVNTNDFKKCFAEAVEDSASYYLLGYYLPQDDMKPGWRKLKVEVDADGAHVHARNGFYVSPLVDDNPASRKQALIDALSSPLEYTGVALSVRAGAQSKVSVPPQNGSGVGNDSTLSQEFMVHVPASSLLIDRQNKNLLDLEIAAVALQHGKSVAVYSQSVRNFFAPDVLARIEKAGVRLSEKLTLAPGKYECRFVVRDNQSGAIGTAILPFELKTQPESVQAPAASK